MKRAVMIFLLAVFIAGIVMTSQAFAGKIARSGDVQPALRTAPSTAARPVLITVTQPLLRALLPMGQVLVVQTRTGSIVIVGGNGDGPQKDPGPPLPDPRVKNDGGWDDLK